MQIEAIKYIVSFVEEIRTLGSLSCVCHGYQTAVSNMSEIIKTVAESTILPLPLADETVFTKTDLFCLELESVSVIEKFGVIQKRIRHLEKTIPFLLSLWDKSPPPKSVDIHYKRGLQQCFDAIQFMVRLGAHKNLTRKITKYSPLLNIRIHTFEDKCEITFATLQKDSQLILRALFDDKSNTIAKTDHSFFCTLKDTRDTFDGIVSCLKTTETALEKLRKIHHPMLFCVAKSMLKIISIYEKVGSGGGRIAACEMALWRILHYPTCFNINTQENTQGIFLKNIYTFIFRFTTYPQRNFSDFFCFLCSLDY